MITLIAINFRLLWELATNPNERNLINVHTHYSSFIDTNKNAHHVREKGEKKEQASLKITITAFGWWLADYNEHIF